MSASPPMLRAKKLVWAGLRSAYHWIPLPQPARLHLRDGYYRVYGLLFPDSYSYRTYLEWKEKQSQANDSENPFAGAYPWDYLKPENSDRPEILESLVGPYIENENSVFDMCCGFSPLSRFLLEKHCRVVGFDLSTEAIEYCKRAYPGGTFYAADDAQIDIPRQLDVLIHLGIAPGTDRWGLESRTEVKTSIRAIRQTLPKVIVLETAIGYSAGYNALKSFVAGLEGYRLQKELVYEFHLKTGSTNAAAAVNCKRLLSIFQKEGNVFSLSQNTLARLLTDLDPSSQAESLSGLNLGFGFLYYAMGRILRPKLALVLGSRKGFSAVCIALAMRDNANEGRLILIDAGYDDVQDGEDLGHGGIGFWRDREGVEALLSRFAVGDIMEVKVMRTSEFAQSYRAQEMPPVDLLLIDADHSYKGFKYDFETYRDFVADDGVILCHDTEVRDGFASRSFGVGKYLKKVIRRSREYEAMSLPVWPGVGIIRKAGPVRGAPAEASDAGWMWKCLRSAYHWTPMPEGLRMRLKDTCFRIYGRAFPKSYRYQKYLETKRKGGST
jgi:predicted O-methyltransferase YrrM